MRFSTLEDLVKHVKRQRHLAKQPKPKVAPETAEQRAANAAAARIEAELQWEPHRLVLLTLHQHCDCGQDYRSVIGLFQESIHRTSKARRLKPPANLQQIDRLPHAFEEHNEPIGICPHCMLERDVVEALMNPVRHETLQLPLFDHTPQRRAA